MYLDQPGITTITTPLAWPKQFQFSHGGTCFILIRSQPMKSGVVVVVVAVAVGVVAEEEEEEGNHRLFCFAICIWYRACQNQSNPFICVSQPIQQTSILWLDHPKMHIVPHGLFWKMDVLQTRTRQLEPSCHPWWSMASWCANHSCSTMI